MHLSASRQPSPFTRALITQGCLRKSVQGAQNVVAVVWVQYEAQVCRRPAIFANFVIQPLQVTHKPSEPKQRVVGQQLICVHDCQNYATDVSSWSSESESASQASLFDVQKISEAFIEGVHILAVIAGEFQSIPPGSRQLGNRACAAALDKDGVGGRLTRCCSGLRYSCADAW